MLNNKSDILFLFEHAKVKAITAYEEIDDFSLFKNIINILNKLSEKDFSSNFYIVNYYHKYLNSNVFEDFCKLRVVYKFYQCSINYELTSEEKEFMKYYVLSKEQEEFVLSLSGNKHHESSMQ